MVRARTLALPLLSVFGLSNGCASPEPAAAGGEPMNMEVEGNQISLSVDESGLPVTDFVKLAQQLTGKMFTYSAEDLERGDPRIHFTGTMEVEKDKFYDVFQTLLYIKGFGCEVHNQGGMEVVEIVSLRDGGQTASRSPAAAGSEPMTMTVDGDQIALSVDDRGLPVTDFVKVAQQLTGKVFTYSAEDLERGDPRIRFIGTMKVEKDKFYDVFQTLLYIKGFGCEVRDQGGTEVVEIVALRGGGQAAPGSH